jgi:hypothetical protein
MICPICNDANVLAKKIKHGQSNRIQMGHVMCYCKKSEAVSRMYSKMLGPLESLYLPSGGIDTRLDFTKNLFIRGSYDSFLLQIKSIIVQNFLTEPQISIYFCRSIDLLHNFYVKQEDGSSPTLADTEKFDLIAFTLDTLEKNNQLKTCLAQIAHTRKCSRKATWVYMARESLSQCVQEYTPELQAILDTYTVVNLKDIGIGIQKELTQSQKSAANFSI